MSVFLMIALLASVGTLILWSICAAAYLAIVLVGAMLPRDSTLSAGQAYCDDDWGMSVQSVNRTPAPDGVSYALALRLSSRALHGPRSARGAWVYLTDERGHRFLPVHGPSAVPLDVVLRPGESIATTLTFHVLRDARELFFTGGVEGISYASLLIGNGHLLRRPRIRFRIQ